MSTNIANFASCLGKYDGSTLVGAGTTLDPSAIAIGNSDLSLNSGYLSNPNTFTTPGQGNGNGFTVTGWFNPAGAQTSNFTPIFDMSGASAVATNHITLCVSGNSLTPALVATFNAQTSVYVPSGSVNANAWNFFGYTVCCSGGTQLVQNLMVNGTPYSVAGGTYTPLTVANTYVGYGISPYNNYFQGKIDDFRYYGRVLCPMEMRVLYSYAYGKTVGPSSANAVAPTLGTVSVGTLTATTAPLIFPSTGTYSYVGVTRTFNGVTTSFNVSPSLIVSSGSNYVWTDTVAFTSSPSASYVITPYILGTPGVSQVLTATIPAPSAITSVTAYNAGIGVFDVSWIGGVGVGVTYTYDVSSSGAIVVPSGNYSTSVLTASSTHITMTNNTAKTYTVVVKATNGIGTVSSAPSNTITTTNPITVAVTGYTYQGAAVTTASGALTSGNGVVKGTGVTGATTYNVYALGQGRNTANAADTNNYVFSYTVYSNTTIYVLAVGGGGSGGGWGAAGGGAGGVYMAGTAVVPGSGTITVSVGNGGAAVQGVADGSSVGKPGTNTTVVFAGAPAGTTITAYGGGGGNTNNASSYGGTTYKGGTSGAPTSNVGGTGTGDGTTGGGGGAGGVGLAGSAGGTGGPGRITSATLNGIKDFTILSNLGSYYYWGGGGGGAGTAATGGIGGGGGSGNNVTTVGGGTALSTGSPGTTNTGGAGGANTGGGGGASYTGVSGAGGSGVVIIALAV